MAPSNPRAWLAGTVSYILGPLAEMSHGQRSLQKAGLYALQELHPIEVRMKATNSTDRPVAISFHFGKISRQRGCEAEVRSKAEAVDGFEGAEAVHEAQDNQVCQDAEGKHSMWPQNCCCCKQRVFLVIARWCQFYCKAIPSSCYWEGYLQQVANPSCWSLHFIHNDFPRKDTD